MTEHARLSPSSSERWLVCADAPNAEAKFPPQRTNVYAQIGTAAHELLELALRLDIDASEIAPEGIPDDMVEAVSLALDYVRGYIADRPNAHVMPERRVYAAPEYDIWGTSDIIIQDHPNELAVIDYKHGYVTVTSWTQQGLYAIGARREFGHHASYRLVTIQPRARHIEGPIREIIVDDTWLDDLLTRARTAGQLSKTPNIANRVAGAHCKYCQAAASCPTLRDKVLKAAIADFTSVPVIDPRPARVSLDPLTIGESLRLTSIVDLWLKAVRTTAWNMIKAGETIEGYKIVAGKKQRYWSDETEVRQAFIDFGLPEDDWAPRSLVSPAGAEKLNKLRKRAGISIVDVSGFVRTKNANPALVPEADPRPALTSGAEFNIVETEENEDG